MNQSAAAISPDNNPGDDEVGPAKLAMPKESPMRFTYKTGSTPLDGYTIKRGVGAGGFGEVYYATTDAGKEVALKHIQRNLDIEMRGAKHCLNLKHPHLVSLFDIRYDSEGEGWIVMEFVHGDSLQDVVERNPNGMPREEALSWFKAIASAVNYLHDHGIVHRDLKPGNIFNDQGTVKIGDYGLSKFISVSRRSGQTESVGTFHYMAPEIGKGRYGREIDVYALGIILFEMLTGRVPFEGESSQEIIMKHLTASPDLGNLGEPFRSVVASALHKDPEKRTSSAEEMLQQLGLKETDGYVATLASHRPTDSQRSSATPAPEPKPEPVYVASAVDEPEVVAELEPAAKGTFDDEPIAQAMGNAQQRFMRWWNHNATSMPVKIIVLVAVAFGVITNLHFILPIGIMLGVFYLAYLFIRLLMGVFKDEETSSGNPQSRSGSSGRYHPEAMKRKHRAAENGAWKPKRKDRERAALATRSTRRRVQELTGSLIASGLTAVVVSSVLLLITAGEKAFTSSAILTYGPSFVFFTGVTVLASWSVMITAKFWENRGGEHARRRLVMAMLGAGIGILAWAASLMMFPHSLPVESVTGGWLTLGEPATVGGMMLFFGLTFLVPCWWKLADPLRSNWLSPATIGVYVAWAALLSIFWPFVQPCGVMLIGAIATTIQFSSPWLNQERRDEARKNYEQALKETTVSNAN
ncbi:serine/threonine protein kinase [Bremerella cremea]|uniref:non-specific serine/threonine protein kinase n=1 Tax=Blastopirellula marina TaxID=124 RepID=A0A2S8FII5_9BACT|nr:MULTISPECIES: serine/threonine-protein kinase [Pirellulaceae]PQO31978.1 serine/threonine protein kinase [Blastopirellula marina]RCS45045.1 serine/threonine protein kinase [Bremerella cremea]